MSVGGDGMTSMSQERVGVMRAVRVVLVPTPRQAAALASHAGAARAAYNYHLAGKVAAHRAWAGEVAYRTYTDHADLPPDAALTAARKAVTAAKAHRIPGMPDSIKAFYADPAYPWLDQVNRYAVSSGMRDADTAWRNWLASLAGIRKGPKIGYPRFKKKGRARDSFTLYHDVENPGLRPDGYRRWIFPKKVGGSIRIKGNVRRLARRIKAETARVKNVTIARSGHQWIASILIEDFAQLPTTPTPRQRRGGMVGVDLGVNALAALSTGEIIDNPRHLARAHARLTMAQRALARTQWRVEATGDLVDVPVRGRRHVETTGRRKARADLTRAHARVAAARAATIHALTKRLATSYRVIVIEDLAVKGMTAAVQPRPDPDRPGRYLPNGRAAKAGLNRAIADAAFGEIRRQLEYKTAWYGATLSLAPRYYPSSKTCSACGAVKATLRLTERTYACHECGHTQDRDINAARNLAALMDAREKQESLNAGRAGPGEPSPASSDAGRSGPTRAPATAAEESPARPRDTHRKKRPPAASLQVS